MPEVSVRIAGRHYPVICGEGEEARVASLAQRIDAEAKALTGSTGAKISESRLLMMAALMLADRLDETEAALAAAREAAAAPPPPDNLADQEDALDAMEDSKERLDALRTGAPLDLGDEDDGEEGVGEDGEMTPRQRRAARRAQRLAAAEGPGEGDEG